jgi:hypothetical protein
VTPPDETLMLAPAWAMVPLAAPPLIVTVPPLDTIVETVVPPDSTTSVPPDRTVTLPLVWPDWMNSVWPLVTMKGFWLLLVPPPDTIVPRSWPPDRMRIVPPLSTVVSLATAPLATSSVTPLLTT